MLYWFNRCFNSLRSSSKLAHQLASLIGDAKFEQADRLALRASRRHHTDAVFLEQYALSAHNSGRHLLARQRWTQLRDLAPDHKMAWTGIACNARELGDLAAATATILEALERFSGDTLLLSEAYRICRITRDHAARALAPVLARAITDDGHDRQLIDDYLSAGRLPRRGVDWRRMDSALQQYSDHQPSALFVGTMLDELHHQWGFYASDLRWVNPTDALSCLLLIVKRDPLNNIHRANLADTLLKLGLLEQAERELAFARALFPDDFSLEMVRASLLAKREQWAEAIGILKSLLAKHGENVSVQVLLAETIAERNYQAEVGSTRQGPTMLAEKGNDHCGYVDERDLVMRFESIGEGCEFGLVQRRYGAEPLGLFRFCTTTVDNLTRSLGARLADLGSPEQTLMWVDRDVEYFVADKRWGFDFHTFRTKSEISYEKLFPKMCQRLVFLRDRFLRDIAAAEKTLIFKSDNATFAELTSLHAVLRLDAPVQLVCVKQASQAPEGIHVKGGDVFQVADGLFVGYLTRSGFVTSSWDILFDEWIAICRSVPCGAKLPFPAAAI